MDNTKRIVISGKDYWWDIKWRALYEDREMTKPMRTKFFSDEETRSLHEQTRDEQNQASDDERSVATGDQ